MSGLHLEIFIPNAAVTPRKYYPSLTCAVWLRLLLRLLMKLWL